MREEVLVVPREHLFPAGAFHGFSGEGVERYLSTISAHAYFAPRDRVERDPSLKQIIPYVVLRYRDRVFLVRRTRAGSEERLREKFSIGIGGHINPEDVGDAADPVDAGMQRELTEEVVVPAGWQARAVGVLNDDQEAVGRVHFGLVYTFCATGIEKTFKKQAAVDTVKVDLDSKLVTIGTKPDENLDDATVTKLLTNAGYSVTGISRDI
jgi:predicted NUDIX family phosphoesterase